MRYLIETHGGRDLDGSSHLPTNVFQQICVIKSLYNKYISKSCRPSYYWLYKKFGVEKDDCLLTAIDLKTGFHSRVQKLHKTNIYMQTIQFLCFILQQFQEISVKRFSTQYFEFSSSFEKALSGINIVDVQFVRCRKER